MSIKKLTEKIKDIVTSQGLSEAEIIRISLYTFIDFSLLISAQAVWCNTKSNEELAMQKIFDDSINQNIEISMSVLLEASQMYFNLVKQHPPFTDLISMVYEELAITDGQAKQFGQYFTPIDLSRCIAQLAAIDTMERARIDLPVSICDPCSGSGSLVMAQLEIIHSQSPDLLQFISIVINDIDEKALRANCLQIMSNLGEHRLYLYSVTATISNTITQYKNSGKLFMLYKGFAKLTDDKLKLETIL